MSSGRSTRSSTRREDSSTSKSTSGKRQAQIRIDESLKPSKKGRQNGKGKSGGVGKGEGGFAITQSGMGMEIQVIDDATLGQPLPDPRDRLGSGRVAVGRGQCVMPMRLNEEEEQQILKDFDLDFLYGACRGISRRERYDRAIKYQLKPQPSLTVKEILDAHAGDVNYENSIWDQNELLRSPTPPRP